jgi:aryl-alcohol dehydrogenase-like predicted oxidoreductase
MTLAGYATSEGTARYRDRFPNAAAGHFRQQQSLWLSSIGIGTYLGDADEATDASYTTAVIRTVELGSNVIDSAANYRFQRSERAIGDALTVLNAGDFQRDELLLCTKGGYLPFDEAPPRDVRRYIEETFVRPGIAALSDFVGGSHCMTPSYLDHQLTQSLKNLGVDCVDVYYVHNPESQLAVVREDEFYARLTGAFEFLEEARSQKRIQYYGVATWNGFRSAPDSGHHHPLERLVKAAQSAGGQAHGLRFIQLPFNLAMTEALSLRNQTVNGEPASTLEAAAAFGITVIASASILQGRVARGLPDEIREPLGALESNAQTAIQFVRSTPGVSTALIGMSRAEHVEENLSLVTVAPTTEENYAKLFGGKS